MHEQFKDILHRTRIQSGYSMNQVSRYLGVSTPYYSQVEGGIKPPFPADSAQDFYARLASLFGEGKAADLQAAAARVRGALEVRVSNEASSEQVQTVLRAAREIPNLPPDKLAEFNAFLSKLNGKS